MKTEKRSHERAAGQTTITASVPASVKERLSALAKADHRTLSNYLCLHFSKILEESAQGDLEECEARKTQIHDGIVKGVNEVRKGRNPKK